MISAVGSLRARRGFRRGACVAAVLAMVSLAPTAARATTAAPALDGCDATQSPLQQALWHAEQSLQAGEEQAVRADVARVEAEGAREPYFLLRAGALLEGLKDQPGADAAYARALAAAKILDPRGDANTGRLYEAAALVHLHRASEAAPLVAAVRGAPDALKTYTCRFIPVAMAMADAGDAQGATELLEAVRSAAPGARSVNDALVQLAFRSNDAARIDRALDAALAQFPTDVAFTVRRANVIKIRGHEGEARALLEKLILAGEEDPNLLGEYLGLVSGEEKARNSLDQTLALATAHPELHTLAMLVGVEYHYLGQYEKSTIWLSKTGNLIDREPRIPMYLAMNQFRLRHQKEAEDLIERAARAGRPDPDIYYCRAIIAVRKDPAAAVRDLEHYMRLTSGRPDANAGKQQRVQQTLDLVRRCTDGPDPLGCVQRDVVDKAMALAFNEHIVALRPEGAPDVRPASSSDPAPARAVAPAHEERGEGGKYAAGAAAALVVVAGIAAFLRSKRRS
jgi:tetratricopeptide (TPR) repeat protein